MVPGPSRSQINRSGSVQVANPLDNSVNPIPELIIADIGIWAPTELNPHRTSGIADQRGRGEDYVAAVSAVLDEPWFLGWHWCAYVENTGRGWRMKDPWDEPYSDFVDPVTAFNTSTSNRLTGSGGAAHWADGDAVVAPIGNLPA